MATGSDANANGPKAGTGLVLSFGGKKAGLGAKRPVAKPAGGNSVFGGGDDAHEEEARPEFIRSLNDRPNKIEEEKAPLVIPVAVPRWKREGELRKGKEVEAVEVGGGGAEGNEEQKEVKKEKTLDELAAEALLREVRGEEKGEEGATLVILMKDKKKWASAGDDAPMLVRNAVPVPEEFKGDEKARLKYELTLREEDIDPSSEVYKAVPVEEFGAALLRGMGWKGPSEDDVKIFEVKRRAEGLGLGADSSVLEINVEGRKKKRRGPHDPVAAKEALVKAAQERLKNQKLQVDDIVRLMTGEHAGRRAVVTQNEGVAGIQMVVTEMEETGEQLRVKTTEAFRVEDAELKAKPFVRAKGRDGDGGSVASVNGRKRSRSVTRSRSTSREAKKKKQKKKEDKRERKEMEKDREKEKDRKRKRERSRSRDRAGRGSDRGRESGRGSGEDNAVPLSERWLAPRIRIRVVTERELCGQGSFYRSKGIVVDVPRPGEAIIQLDSGPVLEGVKAKHLETVVGQAGSVVLILRGPHKLMRAKLLEMDSSSERGVVQLTEDLSVHRLSLDDIAEYRGSMGDDEEMDED